MTSSRHPFHHFASIDLEDWYADVEAVPGTDPKFAADAFGRQLGAILEVLAQTQTCCTFFVLGKTAERYPAWVKLVHEGGHEIASHGYGHGRIDTLTPAEFREDVVRCSDALEEITGQRPIGYRAPYFSVGREQFWFYDILAEAGFSYSSSVFPFAGRRYGIGDHILEPADVRCAGGQTIREFPMAVVEMGGRRLPVAGGGFWRALPGWAVDACVKDLENAGRAFTLYLHPHEFDTKPLRSHRGSLRNLYVNLGRPKVPRTFRHMLTKHSFGTFRDAL